MDKKTIPLAAALLLWQYTHPACAQLPPANATPWTRDAMRAHAQMLWDAYRAEGHGGEQALGEIMATRSLPATRENADALLAALASNAASEEKIWLVRLAGHLHRGLAEEPQTQAGIRSHFSGLVNDTDDAALGKVAALTYSRMGYFPDSLDVLARARSRRFITDDDYFGNIAHFLPEVPSAEQAKLLRVLSEGNNGHARNIVANL